jgi:hypothetical protein
MFIAPGVKVQRSSARLHCLAEMLGIEALPADVVLVEADGGILGTALIDRDGQVELPRGGEQILREDVRKGLLLDTALEAEGRP